MHMEDGTFVQSCLSLSLYAKALVRKRYIVRTMEKELLIERSLVAEASFLSPSYYLSAMTMTWIRLMMVLMNPVQKAYISRFFPQLFFRLIGKRIAYGIGMHGCVLPIAFSPAPQPVILLCG